MPFTLFRKRGPALHPAWQYSSDGVIWRLVACPGELLVGESRNLETKEVSFFCVDALSGNLRWSGAKFGEQWWIGIESVHGDMLLLHKYATPSLPEHKSIIAVHTASGAAVWSHDDLKFEFFSADSIVASRKTSTGEQFVLVAVQSGTILGEITEAKVTELRHQGNSVSVSDADQSMPQVLFELAGENLYPASIIRAHCDLHSLVGPVEFLEVGKAVVFNYHEQHPESAESNVRLNNILKIIDGENSTILFETIVNAGSPSVVPETFFVRKNVLFFIRERSTLTAINLIPGTHSI